MKTITFVYYWLSWRKTAQIATFEGKPSNSQIMQNIGTDAAISEVKTVKSTANPLYIKDKTLPIGYRRSNY